MSKRVNVSAENGASHNKMRREDSEPNMNEERLAKSKESRLKNNNTIDSDDEVDEHKQEETFLNEDDVEGAEDSDVGDELNEVDSDRVEMTPFNLKEEMSSGRFDSAGFYQPNKEEDITDNWMEDVNWADVKKNEKKNKKFLQDPKNEEEDDVVNDVDEIKVLKEIVQLMQPKETVQKSLQRLGASKKSQKKRKWKSENKYGSDDEDEEKEEETSEERRNREAFDEMTELVDQMTGTGYYDIYTDTCEKLQFKIKTLEEEDDDDMFADDFEVKKSKDKKEVSESTSDEMNWEYKWSKDADQVYGPFPTKQMMEWKKNNMFGSDVVARKVSKVDADPAQFYSMARVDFELYLDD